MKPDDRHWTGPAAAEDAMRPVRQRRVDPAFQQPGIDPVEDAVETAPEQPRQHASAGGERPVGGDQVAASALLVHSGGLYGSGAKLQRWRRRIVHAARLE